MVGVVVAREVVEALDSAIVAPEREVGAIGEAILQVIPKAEGDVEVRHELVAPVLGWSLRYHHGEWVIHLLIGATVIWNAVKITVLVGGEIEFGVVAPHLLGISTRYGWGQDRRHIKGRTKD